MKISTFTGNVTIWFTSHHSVSALPVFFVFYTRCRGWVGLATTPACVGFLSFFLALSGSRSCHQWNSAQVFHFSRPCGSFTISGQIYVYIGERTTSINHFLYTACGTGARTQSRQIIRFYIFRSFFKEKHTVWSATLSCKRRTVLL